MYRPKLVGLTASPCKAKTVKQAVEGLNELLKKFGHDTLLYRPSLRCHRKGDETVAVTDAPMQLAVGDKLWKRIGEMCTELRLIRQGSGSTDDAALAGTLDDLMDSNSIGVIKGKAREHAAATNSPESKERSEELMRLLTAWERNAVLGPYAARWFIDESLMPSEQGGAAAQEDGATDYTGLHDGVPEDQLSAQLIELESRLKRAEEELQSDGDQLRCLVFVDTKDTAEVLTDRLKVTFPELSPSKVVGQSMGGMTLPVQRQRIKQFRKGECRLFVCTSVLEEGFDVPECNLVIRIHARASLIQQVQCRGRARAKKGSLVTISSTRWMKHAKELEDQENNLESALAAEQEKAREVKIRRSLRRIRREDDGISASTPENGDGPVTALMGAISAEGGGDEEEQDVEESIDDVLGSLQDNGIPAEGPSLDTREATQEENAVSWVSSVAVKIFLRVDQDASRHVVENIRRAIENMACLPQATSGEDGGSFRICVVKPSGANLGDFGGAAGSSRVLDEMSRLAILSIPTGSRKFLKGFVSSWDFKVKGATEVGIALPPPFHGASDDGFQEGTSLPIGGVMRVSLGYMPSHGTFVRCETLSDTRRSSALSYGTFEIDSGLKWTLKGSSESISEEAEAEVEVTAPISNLGPCLYLSALKKDGSVTVYMPLKSTPSVYYRNGERRHQHRAAVPRELSDGDAARDVYDEATSTETTGDSLASSAQEAAEKHLSMLAMHPVLAVEFTLDQWDTLVAVLQDPRNLGVATLVTRVHGQFSESRTESLFIRGKSRLLEGRRPGPELTKDATVTDALFAFGCLETHIYCLPLHPRCLGSIMRDVKTALAEYLDEGGSSTRIRASTKAMQDLYAHVDNLCSFEDAAAIYHALVQSSLMSAVDGTTRTTCSDELTVVGSDEYFKISRVVVTPSRIVCKPGILMKSSRLMRMFARDHKLVYVTFRDEDGQALYSRFEGRCCSMLEPSGITSWQLQGLELRLLVCSASQMREQTAVFVASDSQEEVEEMHSEIIKNKGPFEGQTFKYISRMGLFCTSESPVVDIEPGAWETIGDSRTADNSKVLTDGSGFIDHDLLSRISSEFPGVVPPGCCAIQIRHGGNKGVLVATPASRPSGSAAAVISDGKKIAMRRSMVKFESDHEALCVVKAAVHHRLRLNRDILNLLFSAAGGGGGDQGGDWDAYPMVNAMQDEELSRLAMVLIDHRAAKLELAKHTAFDPRDLRRLEQCAEIFPNERHFCRLLRHIYDYNIKHLRTKTHIPVELGALLMGIPDPFGILDDGEVFLQIKKADDTDDASPDQQSAEVITGSVLLYRNPLLHPGDMRVLDAVDCADKGPLGAELRSQYVNVVVFPARDGVTRRCIPSECSGGDLDGDMFSVIWDPNLVPPPHRETEPFDYEAHAAEAIQSNPEPPDLSMAECTSRSMTNACLGRIARMHLALSDILPDGARDPLAMEVAEQQSLAVDFPKTGVAPVVPEAAKKLVRDRGHPDFMETKNQQGYPSKKPLGLLYQQCQAIACEISLGSTALETSSMEDSLYVTEGHEAHLADAEKAFGAYRLDVQTALLHFGLSSEVELILALPMQLPEELESKRRLAEQALSDMWKSIKDKYRSWFFSPGADDEGEDNEASAARPREQSSDELLDKASAWYVVAYRSRAPPADAEGSNNVFALPLKSAADDDRSGYLGFPWIVSDMLAKVRERHWNSASAEGRRNGAARMVSAGEDAKAHWQKQILPMVTQEMRFRMAAFNIARDAIMQHRDAQEEGDEGGSPQLLSASAEVFMFGSVSQFLCVPGSDIDIYVHEPRHARPGLEGQAKEAFLLQSPVSAALEDVAPRKSFINGAVSGVPVLRTFMDVGDEELSADVCARPDGLYKTMLLRKLYRLDPCYLPLLACVTEWARACALIRSADDEENPSSGGSCAPLKSGELHALFLHVLQEHLCIKQSDGGRSLNSRGIVPCADSVAELRVEESEEFPNDHHECGGDDHLSFRYLSHAETCDAALLGRLLLAFFDAGSRLPQRLGQEGLVYEWPLPCHPPAVHTIRDGDILKDVARRCARAKHCLARTGSWRAVLDQASGLNDATQDFAVKLQPSTAQRLIDAADFHAERLEALSKAEVRFDIQPGSNITVRARGTPQQIQALRGLLSRLIHSRRLVGAIQCRKGVYFMDNSTFLFARGAAGSSPMLRLSNYIFDGINIRHLHSEISGVALKSAFCEPKDRWKEDFAARYAHRMIEQAERVAEEDRQSSSSANDDAGLVDSLRLCVHFGHYYLLNAPRFFEGKTAAVSLSEVVDALEGLAHRKQYDRTDFDDRPLPIDTTTLLGDDDDQEAAQEGSSGGSDDRSSQEGGTKEPRKSSTKPKLNSGFRNCVIPRKITGRSDLVELIPGIEAWADAVFMKGLGYEQVPDEKQEEAGSSTSLAGSSCPSSVFTRPCHAWQVEVVASGAFQVSVKLDEALNVLAVKERPLRWIHGTLLQTDAAARHQADQDSSSVGADGKPLDMRLKLSTTEEQLESGHTLHDTACPEVRTPPAFVDSSLID